MASILVLGGAGYIGSHAAKALSRAGDAVTVFDDLSTGHRDAARFGRFVQGDVRNPDDLVRLFFDKRFDAVMHFAASCDIGESFADPGKYYANNVLGTINVLQAMRTAGVRMLVFSSSCATYGDPVRLPVDEAHPQNSVSPYGNTKIAAERAMADFGRAYGLRTIALRYFNAAGCDPEGELGDRRAPPVNLIPRALKEALRVRDGGNPEQTELCLYGGDYDTPDGSALRDYVHVTDLSDAHVLALKRLINGTAEAFEAFNLGSERGASVKEVIAVCRTVTGINIRHRVVGRRAGDAPAVVADSRRARKVLNWKPRYESLTDVVQTTWNWLLARGA